MDQANDKIARAHGLLREALVLLDEREFLVEAAFVQSALDRMSETITALHPDLAISPEGTVERLPGR
ncbi:hypothetical protein [Novosphingobium sp. BW1]|uniref:hypothetical protein n=1 Tax=Novosphingobium sp. BW1 TaxID=2592621 RepID=UPI0011DEA5E4|nr:hypothetical protein [Novosphingobium sp. BW1]TYC86324.1 hypothetical protein FMM79_15430 [Novosphingobium sp. BW1]